MIEFQDTSSTIEKEELTCQGLILALEKAPFAPVIPTRAGIMVAVVTGGSFA
jgi:hypothetical protein